MVRYVGLGFIILALFFSPSILAEKNNSEIKITSRSPQFIITQSSNPTTGYSWTVEKYNHALLNLISETYQAPRSRLIGAGGKMIWVFQAKPAAFQSKNNQTFIYFRYARPWNLNDNPRYYKAIIIFSKTL